MEDSSTSLDHVNELNLITNTICSFFSDRHIFHSENLGFPSYNKVRGRDARMPPDNTSLHLKRWPIYNESKKRDVSDAVEACEHAGRTLLTHGKNFGLKVLSRDFMIEGSTLPIRVLYEIRECNTWRKRISKKATFESLYFKQMHLNRIFLGTLYHLAVGRDYCMAFSESSIVEEETVGMSLIEAYEKEQNFLGTPRNKRELVQLATVSYLISLYDMDNGSNIIKDEKGRFDVIDFDKGFWEKIPNPCERLINPFAYKVGYAENAYMEDLPDEKLMRHFKQKELDELVKDSMKTIYLNLKKNMKLVEGVIELMAGVKYYNLAAKELYGEKDIETYFTRRFSEFGHV